MNGQDKGWTIRRILVAVDGSRHSLAALEAASELAAGMDAELMGLFVEDVRLIQAAGAPAAREVRYPFVAAARLDPVRMERELRVQAEQARRAIAATCGPRQIKWSFRVVRGEVALEVLSAAMEADLLILGKVSRPLIRQVRVGSTARAAAARAPCCVLLLRFETGIKPPVVTVYDGSPAAREALKVASHLARRQGGYLAVLNVAATSSEEYRLQAETADGLRAQGLLIRYRQLAGLEVETLAQVVQTEKCGVLVLSDNLLPPEALQALLDRVECPVLLVR